MDPGCMLVAEVLGTNLYPEDMFLVEVGGGNSHDITEFYQKHPNLPDRLILQDLPDITVTELEELAVQLDA
jgi:hypothetical protein